MINIQERKKQEKKDGSSVEKEVYCNEFEFSYHIFPSVTDAPTTLQQWTLFQVSLFIKIQNNFKTNRLIYNMSNLSNTNILPDFMIVGLKSLLKLHYYS